MLTATPQAFGGDWTREKLERVRKYLSAYVQALKNQPFELHYMDAFAGTGYVAERKDGAPSSPGLFDIPELGDVEPQAYITGSARIALEIEPAFHHYLFIERKGAYVKELHALKADYPGLADRIEIVRGDANEELRHLCSGARWTGRRAVLFLDPYAMQVSWSTVEAIAGTEAIDMWYLFPLSAVNRMLARDGRIGDAWSAKLDDVFGTHEWQEAFYEIVNRPTLFGDESEDLVKTATFEGLGRFLVDRLRRIFPGVAKNPLVLSTSKSPLFLLCFAAGNPAGARTAVKIAQDILGRR